MPIDLSCVQVVGKKHVLFSLLWHASNINAQQFVTSMQHKTIANSLALSLALFFCNECVGKPKFLLSRNLIVRAYIVVDWAHFTFIFAMGKILIANLQSVLLCCRCRRETQAQALKMYINIVVGFSLLSLTRLCIYILFWKHFKILLLLLSHSVHILILYDVHRLCTFTSLTHFLVVKSRRCISVRFAVGKRKINCWDLRNVYIWCVKWKIVTK